MLTVEQQEANARLFMQANPWLNHAEALSVALQPTGWGFADSKGRSRVQVSGRTMWVSDLVLEEDSAAAPSENQQAAA